MSNKRWCHDEHNERVRGEPSHVHESAHLRRGTLRVQRLNRGFACATGDIYGFINSDDYLLPGALAAVTAFFRKHPANVFMTGHGFSEVESGVRQRVYPNKLTRDVMLHRADILFQQSTFFPAALYRKAGGFNLGNGTCWDYELFLKFLLGGATHHVIERDLAVFRLHQGSISGSGRLEERYFRDLDTIFEATLGRKRGRVHRQLGRFRARSPSIKHRY